MNYDDYYINKIIQGDCLKVMRDIKDKSIDMILCDLPYGTTSCRWDIVIPLRHLWEQYKRVIKDNGAIVLTASQPFTTKLIASNMKMFKYEWIWEKPKGSGIFNVRYMPMKSHENVLIFYNSIPTYNPQMRKGKPYILKQGRSQSSAFGLNSNQRMITENKGVRYPISILKFNIDTGLHPTQKPVALFEYLIKTYTNEGDLVLDSCIGSGTTAVVAKNLNRRFIGIELLQEYCEIARKRLSNLGD
jgi:site-specific DNA-methyltransferase (adenine-specific)